MNLSDPVRNASTLFGSMSRRGYMRWWHSFRGVSTLTGNSRTFFVEYYMINPAIGGKEPILGQDPYHKKNQNRPSYCMIKAGVYKDAAEEGLVLNAFYSPEVLQRVQKPFYLQIADNVLSETAIKGHVEVSKYEAADPAFMSDCGSMEWDLEVYKSISCHTGFVAGPLSTWLNTLDSFWHAEGIKTHFRGKVVLDGEPFIVSADDSYGYADKHWGSKYNAPWLQLSSCQLYSKRTGKELKYSAFALEGCCPRFLFFTFKPRVMLQLTYTGEDFNFSFARPSLPSKIRFLKKETNKRFIWHIMAQNKNAIIKINANARKELLMPIDYESPMGIKKSTPLWIGADGSATIELYRITPVGPVWIDTLSINHLACEYQKKR